MKLEPIERPSPNHDERPVHPDTVVLHYTGMQSGAAALGRLCDPEARVSAHYLIEEDGRLYRLVREERRAWHAGLSEWAGREGLNDSSIGIEIVNPGHEWGYRGFPEAQMRLLEHLLGRIMERHRIAPERVVAHSDIAPERKEDPGELFDWRRLAAAGLSIWPNAADAPDLGRLLDPEGALALERALARFGYPLANFRRTLTAFRRRFRPNALEGPPVMRDFLIARELAARFPAQLDGARPITSPEFTREGI